MAGQKKNRSRKLVINEQRRRDRRYKNLFAYSGFTLVEIVISILIIMVLATGAMGYQYYSVRDVNLSEVQATAVRMSMLLLEGWKGVQGDEAFDPVSAFETQITISSSMAGPAVPTDKGGASLALLGYYEIEVQGTYYYTALSWKAASSLEPKVLNATTTWRRDYGQGALQGDELSVQYSTFYVDY